MQEQCATVATSPAGGAACASCAAPGELATGSLSGFFSRLLDTTGFAPRWQCGEWTLLNGWLHVASDAATWTAYMAIPILLIYFVRRRGGDVPFPRLFWLFGAFILLCGITHLLEAVAFWWPAYRLMGLAKALTAILSLGTVLALIPTLPQAVALPRLARMHEELKAEAAERERAETKFRRALDLSPTALLLLDERGRIRLVNRQTEVLFGYSAGELLGRPVTWLMPRAARGTDDDWRRFIIDTPTALNLGAGAEFIAQRSTGEQFPIELGLSPIETPEGIVNLVAIIDVTERKQQEQARIAQQREESVAMLAGGIAHDFNNLLVSVVAKASWIEQRTAADSTVHRYSQGIVRASERMAELARQLLAYARGGKLCPQVVDLNTIVRETIDLARELLPPDVLLDLRLTDEPAALECDPGQMAQIILNLAANAGDAMGPHGRLSIRTARTRREAWRCANCGPRPAGDYIELVVADNGGGMSAETVARALEPFFSTKGTGRGLGLAAVAGIVRNHGGALELASQPKSGTTVTVRLPAADAAPPRVGEPVPRPVAETRLGRILLVEDDIAVRDITSELLLAAGHQVRAVGDGAAAIEACRAEAPDLAIVDLRLPGMSGTDVFDAITRLRPAMPILISSGYDASSIPPGTLQHRRFAGFVPKPYRAGQLLEAVRIALQARLSGLTCELWRRDAAGALELAPPDSGTRSGRFASESRPRVTPRRTR